MILIQIAVKNVNLNINFIKIIPNVYLQIVRSFKTALVQNVRIFIIYNKIYVLKELYRIA